MGSEDESCSPKHGPLMHSTSIFGLTFSLYTLILPAPFLWSVERIMSKTVRVHNAFPGVSFQSINIYEVQSTVANVSILYLNYITLHNPHLLDIPWCFDGEIPQISQPWVFEASSLVCCRSFKRCLLEANCSKADSVRRRCSSVDWLSPRCSMYIYI